MAAFCASFAFLAGVRPGKPSFLAGGAWASAADTRHASTITAVAVNKYGVELDYGGAVVTCSVRATSGSYLPVGQDPHFPVTDMNNGQYICHVNMIGMLPHMATGADARLALSLACPESPLLKPVCVDTCLIWCVDTCLVWCGQDRPTCG